MRIFLFVAAICLGIPVGAQKYTDSLLHLNNNSSVRYDMYQNRPEELFHTHVSVMPMINNIGFTNELAYSRIVPRKFIVRGGVYLGFMQGLAGGFVSGTYYLYRSDSTRVRQSNVRLKLNSSDHSSKTYPAKGKVEVVQGRYLGLHGEAAYYFIRNDHKEEFFNKGIDRYLVHSVSYAYVGLGIGYNSFRGTQIKVKRGNFTGNTRLFTAVADFVYLPYRTMDSEFNGNTQVNPDLTVEEVATEVVGFRAYAQLQITFNYWKDHYPSGCFGVMWRAGLLYGPHRNFSYYFYRDPRVAPEIGVGVFYTFDSNNRFSGEDAVEEE